MRFPRKAAVQLLADSPWGKCLQSNLEARKPQIQAEWSRSAEEQARARAESRWYGPERPKFLGPLEADYPPWLRGDAPADYGFDPLALSREPAAFERNFELEILHARWAMLGALGALVPEALQYTGVTSFAEPRWWAVGAAKLNGEDLNYLGVSGLRIAGGQGILIIAFCQVLLMFGPEYARACGSGALEPLGIALPDKNYPGTVWFDPLNLAGEARAFERLRVQELKHGRLAMVAWLGFTAQALVTCKGPLQNAIDFVQDPAHNNVAALLGA
ncbi:hypothetical protein WJX81_000231 [Elliptochloris bilobata]|uniref:Chlorophyll a-b binding protein, chloroplastic n=1 Tax=Elliptochloris bilobata TaxID=381761 RepID=A0AAW1QCV1_9CHLO